VGTRLNVERAFHKALAKLKQKSPQDTGNLRYNAIKGEWMDEKTFHIYVDEKLAPYMVYTNEPWTSPYWRGKKNPNEHWWNSTIQEILRMISNNLQGILKNPYQEEKIKINAMFEEIVNSSNSFIRNKPVYTSSLFTIGMDQML